VVSPGIPLEAVAVAALPSLRQIRLPGRQREKRLNAGFELVFPSNSSLLTNGSGARRKPKERDIQVLFF
jgi:hypothetical protein